MNEKYTRRKFIRTALTFAGFLSGIVSSGCMDVDEKNHDCYELVRGKLLGVKESNAFDYKITRLFFEKGPIDVINPESYVLPVGEYVEINISNKCTLNVPGDTYYTTYMGTIKSVRKIS